MKQTFTFIVVNGAGIEKERTFTTKHGRELALKMMEASLNPAWTVKREI